MRSRIALWISLVLNVALAAAFGYFISRREPPKAPPVSLSLPLATNNPIIKTNVVVRRQNFSWQEIESTNYFTFIANLRAIGCPEPTIRDLIIAEVNTLYDRKRATEIVTPEQQWWRSAPDQQVVTAAMSQLHGLEAEKRNLLNQLLGAKWEAANSWEVAAFNMRLDGPILGTLTAEAKQSLRDIETRVVQQKEEYANAKQRAGESADPAESESTPDAEPMLSSTAREELGDILAELESLQAFVRRR